MVTSACKLEALFVSGSGMCMDTGVPLLCCEYIGVKVVQSVKYQNRNRIVMTWNVIRSVLHNPPRSG